MTLRAARAYSSSIVRGWDLYVGIVVGVVAGILTLDDRVRNAAVPIAITEEAIGVALTATVFGAVAIFATFYDAAYRRALEAAGGFRSALIPYVIVGVASAITGVLGLVVALALPELGQRDAAIAVGASTFLCGSTLAGTVSLIDLTLFHATTRARLLEGSDDAARALTERRAKRAS